MADCCYGMCLYSIYRLNFLIILKTFLINNKNVNDFLFIKLAPKKVRPEPFISPQLRAPNCGGGGQTDYNCCKSNNPCSEGMGDCDFDSDCFGGLKCGTNNCWTQFRVQNGYNWDIQADCCYGKRFHKRQKEKSRDISHDVFVQNNKCVNFL